MSIPYRASHRPCYLIICLLAAGVALADGAGSQSTSLFWGDLHLHSSYSPDASMNGNVLIGPDEAYQFASGNAVRAHNGQLARLERPLDFLLVADHAEYLGLLPQMRARDPQVMQNEHVRRWAELIDSEDSDENWQAMFEVLEDIETNSPRVDNQLLLQSNWERIVAAAERHNRPGEFTALIGYEWTSMPGGDNLHRVVLFGDGAEKANQITPFSAFDSEDPEDLWDFMARYEEQTGGRVMAIPHNGNLSNGRMFALTDANRDEIDPSYAERRKRWEPVYEVTQIKGDGETHPRLSPGDAYADFGTWAHGNLTSTVAKQPEMLEFEYARSALSNGLLLQQQVGTNPFQFGMVGSSDAHTGLAAVAEDNFWGKFSVYEPGLTRLTHKPIARGKNGKAYDLWAYEMVAAGYAAVWATENTRSALFSALQRREVYATTGSRIQLQFFVGWHFSPDDARRADFSAYGYSEGVPMGAELGAAETADAPTLIYQVRKDPDGVNLSIAQVVKGWVDTKGNTQERIFDLSSAESVPELAGFWRDPDFDRRLPAYYYLRVLEAPRKRWSTLAAERLQTDFDGKVPETIRDRAYSSPVWYWPNRLAP